jgi:hypothetical protein
LAPLSNIAISGVHNPVSPVTTLRWNCGHAKSPEAFRVARNTPWIPSHDAPRRSFDNPRIFNVLQSARRLQFVTAPRLSTGTAVEHAARRKAMNGMVQFATLFVATVLAVGTAVALNWILLRVAFQLMQPAAARRAAPERPRGDLSRGAAQLARAYVAQR